MIGYVDDLDRVAKVRLVIAVFQHRRAVGNARERRWRHLAAAPEFFKYAMKHRLDRCEDVVLGDEAHLEIELVELAGRAIGARILVAEARRDLEIDRKSVV